MHKGAGFVGARLELLARIFDGGNDYAMLKTDFPGNIAKRSPSGAV